jgi:P27 family predicted phage terminase small subunit
MRPDRVNFYEPRPIGKPQKPDWLSPVAEEEWSRVAPILEQSGVLAAGDETMFAVYCESVARTRRLIAQSIDAPNVIPSRQDSWVKNPIFGQVRDAVSELDRLARQFGLTPSSRSGIRVEIAPAEPSTRILDRVING